VLAGKTSAYEHTRKYRQVRRQVAAYAGVGNGTGFCLRGKEIEMTAAAARAVRFDRYGGREVPYITDIEMPTPDPGEVVVEVRAAGINPGEAGIRVGALHDMFPATFPSGEGGDLAGVVTAVAPGVTEFSVGDEVLGPVSGDPAMPPKPRSRWIN
jgi:hypothetical protein